MRIASIPSVAVGFYLALVNVELRSLRADVVHLKNGSRIEGKAVDNRQKGGNVIIEIGSQGRVILHASEVEKIEPSTAAAAPAAREYVSVKVGKGGDYYGETSYRGYVSPESDDKTIVLELASGVKMRLPRAGAEVSKREAPAARPAAETGRAIKTTHNVQLANGHKLSGTLIPTPATDPVKLQIGNMGVVTIPRDKIAPNGIEAVEGTLQLPEEPAQPERGQAPRQKPELTPELREQLKRELKAELLRELLDQLIGEKIESALGRERAKGMALESVQEGLSNEDILAVQDEVRELSRERTRNRVRAENHLKAIGAAAFPYLTAVAHHPFELTRRAVQRIVRDVGDIRGASLAIDALNDPDDFVRALAYEALQKILPASIRYSPSAGEKERLRAQAEYLAFWEDALRAQAREALLRSLAGR
jgi:hypothetical protein